MMLDKLSSPVDIVCRELYRLDNDIDRLQMLVTLKSHLHHLQLTPSTLQFLFSIFHTEQYRLQAIQQLIPFVHSFITTDSLPILLELFTKTEYRLNLIEILKNYEPLKADKETIEILDNEYREYFHVKKVQSKEHIQLMHSTESNITRVLSHTSGVFEKAKQFVCRVFGGVSSLSSVTEQPSNKRLIHEVNPSADHSEQKKFHSSDTDLQFQPTTISLSTSQSYTSIITKSPPPSPIEQPITRQSSMSFHVDESSLPVQSMMVTQIHSILDNIDSVLDKIEAQTNAVVRRPAFSENYPRIEIVNSDTNISEDLSSAPVQQSTDQITQTAMNIIERHLNMNDGSGDTTPVFIDLIDMIEESNSILSSDENEEMTDSFH